MFLLLQGFATASICAFTFGCGAARKTFLDRKQDVTPLDFANESFEPRRSPLDLGTSLFPQLSEHFLRAQACFPNTSYVRQQLFSTQLAQNSLTDVLKMLSPLPEGLAQVSKAGNWEVQQSEFIKQNRPLTKIEKVLEGNAISDSGLFERKVTDWAPFSKELTNHLARDLKTKNVKLESARGRSVYVLSLEPGNEFQFLLQCGQISLTLADGTPAQHLWPVYMALEKGTLQETVEQSQSLRDLPQLSFSAGFSFRTPERIGSFARRHSSRQGSFVSANEFTLETQFLQPRKDSNSSEENPQTPTSLSRMRTVFYRENARLYFMRFYGIQENPEKASAPKQQSFASFQHGFAKAHWENKSNAAGTQRYLGPRCEPASKESDVSFLKGGLHWFEPVKAREFASALEGKPDILPQPLGDALCVALATIPDKK
jgi:hypothetical protein